MILAFALFFSAILLGFSISSFFNLNPLRRLAFAIATGLFFSAWVVFLVSLLFDRLSFFSVSVSAIIITFSSHVMLERNAFSWKKTSITLSKRIIHLKGNLHLAVYILILAVYLAHFLIGLRTDEFGNVRCIDGFCSDAPFHMAIINSFVNGNDMDLEYPLLSGTKMSYPFMSDFLSAALAVAGLPFLWSVIIPSLLFVFSFITLAFCFIHDITKNKTVTSFALLLFFFGGIGFFNLLAAMNGNSFDAVKINLYPNLGSVRNVVSYPYFNFAEVLTNIFIPQRAYLVGFPMALIVLAFFYRNLYRTNKKELLLCGILTGLLPFFHAHSFIVLSFAALILWILKYFPSFSRIISSPGAVASARKFFAANSEFAYLAVPTVLLSLPQILWIMHVPKIDSFFGFVINDGFWYGDVWSIPVNHFVFWARTMGFPFLLGIAGFALSGKKARAFFVPFLLLFLLVNILRFQPSFGDDNKITLYFLLFMSLFSAVFLKRIFDKNSAGKFVVLLIILLSSIQFIFYAYQNLFVAQQAYDNMRYKNTYPVLFNKVDFEIAGWILENTPEKSIFLTEDSANHLISLTGRTVVKGVYAWNLGVLIDDPESGIMNIYETGNCGTAKKYGIDYIFIGPDELPMVTYDFSGSAGYKKIYELEEKGARFQIFEVECK